MIDESKVEPFKQRMTGMGVPQNVVDAYVEWRRMGGKPAAQQKAETAWELGEKEHQREVGWKEEQYGTEQKRKEEEEAATRTKLATGEVDINSVEGRQEMATRGAMAQDIKKGSNYKDLLVNYGPQGMGLDPTIIAGEWEKAHPSGRVDATNMRKSWEDMARAKTLSRMPTYSAQNVQRVNENIATMKTAKASTEEITQYIIGEGLQPKDFGYEIEPERINFWQKIGLIK